MSDQVRELTTRTVKKFLGISMWESLTAGGPDHANDLLNVIVDGSGALMKLRQPVALSVKGNFANGPKVMRYYSIPKNNERHLVCQFDSDLYTLDPDQYAPVPIEVGNPKNLPSYDWVSSNNILFGANGLRMVKWLGNNPTTFKGLLNWGLPKPASAPVLGLEIPNCPLGLDAQGRLQVDLGITSGFVNVGDRVQILNSTIGDQYNGIFTVVISNPSTGVIVTSYVVPNPGTAGGRCSAFIRQYHTLDVSGTATRRNGTVTAQFSDIFGAISRTLNGLQSGPGPAYIRVSNATTPAFNGLFAALSFDSVSDTLIITWRQDGADDTTVSCNLQLDFQPTLGVSWKYAYYNLVTGHCGPASDPSPYFTILAAGPVGSQIAIVSGVHSPADELGVGDQYQGGQYTHIAWFRTLDSGGDYFFLGLVPVDLSGGNLGGFPGQETFLGGRPTPSVFHTLVDGYSDLQLSRTFRAPINNFPPPLGKFLTKWMGRIFIAGLTDAGTDIAYSAMESIAVPFGRPEECFLPNNRLRLATGADDINGIGAIQAGLVAFSKSDKMYMLRGTVQDIVVDRLPDFADILEELPWGEGCNSHYTIKSTPHGLIWWGSDNHVKMYNGVGGAMGALYFGGPRPITFNIVPFIRRVTSGTKLLSRASYFRFAERDWYALLLCIDGSLIPNFIVILDVTPIEDPKNIGIMIWGIAADDIAVTEDTNGDRHLVISKNGQILEIQFQSEAVSGVAPVRTVNPDKTVIVPAYWESGGFGNDTSEHYKIFRFGHLVSDQQGSSITAKLVDDDNTTLIEPMIMELGEVDYEKNRFAINFKSRRAFLRINLPQTDATCNISELSLSWRELSAR